MIEPPALRTLGLKEALEGGVSIVAQRGSAGEMRIYPIKLPKWGVSPVAQCESAGEMGILSIKPPKRWG